MPPKNTPKLGKVTYRNDPKATARALELIAEILLRYERDQKEKREQAPPQESN